MTLTIESFTVPDIYDEYAENPDAAALIKLYMAAEGDEDGDFDEWASREMDKLAASDVYVIRAETPKILGFLAVNITELRGQKTLFVEAIAVDTSLRRRKIGSRIMAFAEMLALDNDCTSIQGYALDDPQVVSFYERHGYGALHTRGSYVHMAKALE